MTRLKKAISSHHIAEITYQPKIINVNKIAYFFCIFEMIMQQRKQEEKERMIYFLIRCWRNSMMSEEILHKIKRGNS